MPPTPADCRSVLFLHVPKTAGTTVRNVIARQYAAAERYFIGEDINGDIRALRAMETQRRTGLRVVAGHMSYGLHRYLSEPACYLTMLRQPLRRALSDYAFVTSTPRHPIYEAVRHMSISQYLTSGITGQLSNGQTRLLAGDCAAGDTGIPTLRPLTEADLERAMEHLERHFVVAGVQERFDETLMLMRRALGWSLPWYLRSNVTSRPYPAERLAAGEQDLIESRNVLDRCLYEHVRQRLERDLEAAGPAFRRDLSAFRVLNRIYQRAAAVPLALRARLVALRRRARRIRHA